MKIREFDKADLIDVKDLVDKTIDICYSSDYCAEAVKFFKDWHHNEKILKSARDGFTIVLDDNDKIIGTGTIVGDEIMRVFVDPAFQKNGFGKKIMQMLEDTAISNGVETIKLDASLPSKSFYDTLDYSTIEKTFLKVENNKRLDYYKMKKVLSGTKPCS